MIRPLLSEDALAEIEGMQATLSRIFTEAGYTPVEPAHLFPAETMLELYGEDIRSRAFLFPDPELGGELCLRPDFTVPVALAHGRGGWERTGGYSYCGPVFRRQEAGSGRPIEYLQAGLEDFGGTDRAATDAKIFALVMHGLDALSAPVHHVTIGDLGIILDLLGAMDLARHRRDGLARHLWRPNGFKRLLKRYRAAPRALSDRRRELFEAVRAGAVGAMAEGEGEVMGLRGLAEVIERAERLAEGLTEAPMSAEQAGLIEAVLAVNGPVNQALSELTDLARAAGPSLRQPLDRFERRLQAMSKLGLDPEAYHFDAAFGRNLEYYDGFVFEVLAARDTDLPPLAGGGRYDSITPRLGAAEPVAAVGAMIRPEAVRAAVRRIQP